MNSKIEDLLKLFNENHNKFVDDSRDWGKGIEVYLYDGKDAIEIEYKTGQTMEVGNFYRHNKNNLYHILAKVYDEEKNLVFLCENVSFDRA